MMTGINKAHTDAKSKDKKKNKNINITIMKQIKTRQNMYSYKYDNNILICINDKRTRVPDYERTVIKCLASLSVFHLLLAYSPFRLVSCHIVYLLPSNYLFVYHTVFQLSSNFYQF